MARFEESDIDMVRLQDRSWSEPNICVLCKKDAETLEHILLTREYTNTLWAKCASAFNLNLDMSVDNDVWGRARVDNGTRGLKLMIVVAMCWHV